jgi:pimeloyl-ACP methyl ester carboxylesterase
VSDFVLVHGAWHGAWCWQPHCLDHFAAHGYRCHAFSLRGHGRSTGSLRWASLRDYVADLRSVIEQFDTVPVLVAHSMGTAVAQLLLEQDSAPAAVLMAPVPPQGVWRATWRILRRDPVAFARANLGFDLAHLVDTPERARALFHGADMPADELQWHASRLGGESYRAFLDMLLLDRPRPRKVRTPVLVLGGSDDGIFTPAEVHATAQAYGTQARIFEGMPHNLLNHRSWQQVAQHILDWLAVRLA